MSRRLYVGLMSGTSLDGIDAVLADFDASKPLLATRYDAFTPTMRSSIAALLNPGFAELERCAMIANELAERYAHSVHALLTMSNVTSAEVCAIGCHGQTVRHQPQRGYTVQLVNGALLAELTGVSVICDFRSRDIAAGGQGAPLVPAYHESVFASAEHNRAIVNIGGIANITWLPSTGSAEGFDCGPGNVLLDEWITSSRGLPYDAGGAWAARGRVIPALLGALLAHPYFDQLPPKSTGRETFNLDLVQAQLVETYEDDDVQATLAELTARGIANSIERWCSRAGEVFVCGGGVHNADLIDRIRRLLANCRVQSTSVLGLDPDWVEGLAFAWLAREFVEQRAGNLPGVTGASGRRRLGCIYPA